MLKVDIDKENCIGCGMCCEICPEVFQIASDGYAEVYADSPDLYYAKIEEAASGCPTAVITYSVEG